VAVHKRRPHSGGYIQCRQEWRGCSDALFGAEKLRTFRNLCWVRTEAWAYLEEGPGAPPIERCLALLRTDNGQV